MMMTFRKRTDEWEQYPQPQIDKQIEELPFPELHSPRRTFRNVRRAMIDFVPHADAVVMIHDKLLLPKEEEGAVSQAESASLHAH